jgi:predicted nucleotidyltransferase
MENHLHSSEKLSKGEWISSFIDLVLSFYAELITRPFANGLFYFPAGLIPALVVGWILFPMALYSKQPQPIAFNHALHINPDAGISGDTELERCIYCHAFRADGTFDPARSDIDFLVEMEPGRTLFDLGGLSHDLEVLLKRRVDVCTVPLLREQVRERIISEAIPL